MGVEPLKIDKNEENEENEEKKNTMNYEYRYHKTPFTEEDGVLYVNAFPHRTPTEWTDIVISHHTSLDVIRYLLERGLLDIYRASGGYCLLEIILLGTTDSFNKFMFLDRLFEMGADPNSCCEKDRRPLIVRYMLHCISLLEDGWSDDIYSGEMIEELTHLIKRDMTAVGIYLLEKGADPLLEDKDGRSLLSTLDWLPADLREELARWI